MRSDGSISLFAEEPTGLPDVLLISAAEPADGVDPHAARLALADGTLGAEVEEAPADVSLAPDACRVAELAAWSAEEFTLEPQAFLSAAPEAPIDAAQILRDRPDVHAAFYREFFGPGNDRNSSAWIDRVGGETPEDYARYWYAAHGRHEGYTPGSVGAAAPLEGAETPAAGRTTLDGVPIAAILADRPDVFRAFFTEYYAAGNDRHSDAWVKRVGGTTVEDYAEYWYNAHGRLEGYRPSTAAASDPEPPTASAPPQTPPVEDPSLDPWDDPTLVPDWQAPEADGAADAQDALPEDPFVYSDPGAPMLRIVPGQSLMAGEDPII